MSTSTIKTFRHLQGLGIFRDIATGQASFEFKKFNLIYGFNGCGKTTLSRIFDSISGSGARYDFGASASYSILFDDNSVADNGGQTCSSSRQIFVFNEDFIERSLTWKTGDAKPIVYIGEEQAGLAAQLRTAELHEAEARRRLGKVGVELGSASRALERFARDTARNIAEELMLGRRYTAANLHADYAAVPNMVSNIDADTRKALKALLLQDDPPEKFVQRWAGRELTSVGHAVARVVRTQIGQIVVEDLAQRLDALAWIQEGLHIHSSGENCLFCGEELTAVRRQALEDALASGFNAISRSISETLAVIDEVGDWLTNLRSEIPSSSETFQQLSSRVTDLEKSLIALIADGQRILAAFRMALEQKQASPSSEPMLDGVDWVQWDMRAKDIFDRWAGICLDHNTLNANFRDSKLSAAQDLKLYYLSLGAQTYRDLSSAKQVLENEEASAVHTLGAATADVERLRQELRAHGPAAVELNKCIKGYLGHGRLTLQAQDEGYAICRNGVRAEGPLSEGEKTAIAFCYFITLLNAEGRAIRDLIVVVDDPISSLDTRALTHVSSMIRRRLGGVSQLLVLTHNLDFMREMKKWLNRKREDGSASFLFIDTKVGKNDERHSSIVEMPKLIREYESEYHYLFSLVLSCAEQPESSGDYAYLMPNAIRKVMDIFLAFKEPGSAGLESKIDKVISENNALDGDRIKAMERLAQLESHADSIGDTTTFSAYTLEQVSDGAKCLIEMIEVLDKQHCDSMRRLCRRERTTPPPPAPAPQPSLATA